MSNISKAIGVMIFSAALGGCASHGPDGVAYSSGDGRSVGATMGGAGGSVSGSAPAEKEQRANTRPGMDRDGHGPADGAIVDPTGAATRAKPY